MVSADTHNRLLCSREVYLISSNSLFCGQLLYISHGLFFLTSPFLKWELEVSSLIEPVNADSWLKPSNAIFMLPKAYHVSSNNLFYGSGSLSRWAFSQAASRHGSCGLPGWAIWERVGEEQCQDRSHSVFLTSSRKWLPITCAIF